MTDLPKCPVCGNTVEYFSRETWCAGNAWIRCVGHHKIGKSFSPGSKTATRELLIKEWEEWARQQEEAAK